MDLDERLGNRHHTHVTWHGGANADGEVDVVGARHIAAGQHRLPNLRALLRGQAGAAARLALLRLSLLRSLAWLSLAWLSLAWLSLAWLSLAWLSLPWLTGLIPLWRLTGLASLTLLAWWSLTRGLLALLLPLATLLGLTLLALRLTLLALLRARFALTLRRLACGLSFLAALRLALLLSLRGLLGLTLLALLRRRLRLLPLGGAAALFSSTLHGLS
jgi:hypothetical protein